MNHFGNLFVEKLIQANTRGLTREKPSSSLLFATTCTHPFPLMSATTCKTFISTHVFHNSHILISINVLCFHKLNILIAHCRILVLITIMTLFFTFWKAIKNLFFFFFSKFPIATMKLTIRPKEHELHGNFIFKDLHHIKLAILINVTL